MKDISEIALTDDSELLLKIRLNKEQLEKVTKGYEGKEHFTHLFVFSDGKISILIKPVV